MYDETRFNIGAFLGLDQSVEPAFLDKGSSPDALNVDTSGGMLCTAPGHKFSFSIPSSQPSLFANYISNNPAAPSLSKFFCFSQDKIYYYSAFYEAWYEFANAPGVINSAVNYQIGTDSIMIAAGSNIAPQKFNGTAFSALGGSPPKFNTIAVHGERLWGSGALQYPDRLYYSKDFNPEVWNEPETSGFIDLPTWNGGTIKCIRSMFNELVVFKDHDIFRINGKNPANFTVTRAASECGPVGPRAIAFADEGAYFFTRDGLFLYNGVRSEQIGAGRLKKIAARLNYDALDTCVGVIYGRKLLFSLPLDGAVYAGHILEYDLDRDTFLIRDEIYVTAFGEYKDMLFFGTYNKKVYRYGKGSEHFATLKSHWVTPEIDLGMKNVVKSSTAVYAYASGNGQIELEMDFDGKKKIKRFKLSPTPRTIKMRLRGRGRRFQLTIRNVAGSTFRLQGPQILLELDED